VIWLGIVLVPVASPVLLIGYLAIRARRRYLERQAASHPAAPTPTV
jgi:hypothetical protein